MSQKTTPAEEKYSSYELEVLAVVTALKKFRTYLLGNHFKIITDCSAFQDYGQKRFSYSYNKISITVRRVCIRYCTSLRPENATCRRSEQVPSHDNYKRYSHRKTTKSPTRRQKYTQEH
ncbi:retrovirus-related Pol polyprotein from transposon 17.6 [Trichonephila clavipes]|nr:retrovirus-related Pol polyprotein from transposon 17.6 [Trichonephila clavipes]